MRARPPDQPPLEAVRALVLDGLRRRDPSTGLNDDPEIIAFLRLITTTESLTARLARYTRRSMGALSDALQESGLDPLTARLVAAQVVVLQRELTDLNHARLAGGETAADRYPEAVRATNRAFDLLRNGLGSRLRSPTGFTRLVLPDRPAKSATKYPEPGAGART